MIKRDKRWISSEEQKRKKWNHRGGNNNLIFITQKNTSCSYPREPSALLPSQIKGFCLGVQIPLLGQPRATQRWFLFLWCWIPYVNFNKKLRASVSGARNHHSCKKYAEVADLVLRSSQDVTTVFNTRGGKCQVLFICLVLLIKLLSNTDI